MVNVEDVFIDYFVYKVYVEDRYRGISEQIITLRYQDPGHIGSAGILTEDDIRNAISTFEASS